MAQKPANQQPVTKLRYCKCGYTKQTVKYTGSREAVSKMSFDDRNRRERSKIFLT